MNPTYQDNFVTFYAVDALTGAKALPEKSVHCIVTSPPYWGLRSYLPTDHSDKGLELGAEAAPEEYVEKLVEIFRALGRVLRDDGTLWLNIGDCYNAYNGGAGPGSALSQTQSKVRPQLESGYGLRYKGLKPKDLVGIPWRVAFALQADGWYLRSDIVWSKPNPMPESVADRPTKSHEYVFLLSKSQRYFYDQEAVREPHVMRPQARPNGHKRRRPGPLMPEHTYSGTVRDEPGVDGNPAGRNTRSVWNIATKPFPGAHYATFPPKLAYPCIKAGTSEGGVCGTCGTQTKRVLERYDTGQRQKMGDGWDTGEGGHGAFHRDGRQKGETDVPVMANRTVAWETACTCEAKFVPATVLDPFVGSGTTAYAARKLGRRSIGFDLDERNTVLIEGRLGNQGVLL